jgi:type IV secretion system protein TrbE
VIFGFHTMTVLVMDEDEARVELMARDVRKQIERCGFGAQIERGNAVEAVMGSWPGHGAQNVRREPIHSMNLADILPLTSIWAGSPRHPSPYFPNDAPPVMLCATSGQTPFWFTPYVNEVGHVLVIGPTRSGKSTLIALWVAQFLRYAHAQVVWFDKGYSSYVLAHACGAAHYDIGADAAVAFAPLAHVEEEAEREWALGWLEELLLVQGVRPTPAQRRLLWRALTLMGERPHSRTMSGFVTDVQDHELKAALEYYTIGGGAGSVLDAAEDSLRDSHFMVFEVSHLLTRGDKDLIPVLLYLFHRIDQRCARGVPTFIPIDEAWLMMMRSLFAQKIDLWLREKAKQNAAIAFVSQSLAEVERCPQRTILMESCQTKIFLPNAEARTAQSRQLYLDVGLNEQQVDALATAIPQQQYLYLSPYGRRLFDLQLGPVGKAFTGAGSQEDIARAQELIAQHGAAWPALWLREHGCEREAQWWERWVAANGFTREENQYATLWTDRVDGDHHRRDNGVAATTESRAV